MKPLQLKIQNLIGEGQDRAVYQHPDFADRCVKIAKYPTSEEFSPKGFRDNLFYLSRLGNKKLFDFNYVDVHYAQKLQRENSQENFKHIPLCFGFVETNLGRGVIWEKIVNDDGSPCESLKSCRVAPEYQTIEERKKLWQALDSFFNWQIEHAIMLREIAWINTLVKRRNDGSLHIYHIDAIGCVDFIPLADISTTFARLRVRSKVNRFRKRAIKALGAPPQ